jgi:hypothetical protein
VLRGISLSYAVNGLALKPASSDAVSSIQKEIGIAQADVDAAEARASRYTGGILQVTTLMEAQTNRVRASVLKLQLAIAVLGLATVPQGQEAGLPHAPAVGHTVDDKGAL